jgi:crotonobetainyl-CoA:carnitine CoA-transferase CaiB-like acyl-CoA transferase
MTSSRRRAATLPASRPDCDIVVHNFRPGVMEKLGLSYEDIRAANPQVVYASASRWHEGARREARQRHPAQAMSGLMSVTGDGEAPVPRVRRPPIVSRADAGSGHR